MNLPYPDDFDDDDRMLHASLEPLRNLTTPAELETKCVQLVSEMAKASDGVQQQSSPSRNHLSVLFLAVAASLLVGTAIGWTLRGSHKEAAPVAKAEREPINEGIFESAILVPTQSTSQVEITPDSTFQPTYFAEEFYLCGVGVIQSSSRYEFLKESK